MMGQVERVVLNKPTLLGDSASMEEYLEHGRIVGGEERIVLSVEGEFVRVDFEPLTVAGRANVERVGATWQLIPMSNVRTIKFRAVG